MKNLCDTKCSKKCDKKCKCGKDCKCKINIDKHDNKEEACLITASNNCLATNSIRGGVISSLQGNLTETADTSLFATRDSSIDNACTTTIESSNATKLSNCENISVLACSSVNFNGASKPYLIANNPQKYTIASSTGSFNQGLKAFTGVTILSTNAAGNTISPRASNTVIGGNLVSKTWEINSDLGTFTSSGAISPNTPIPGLSELLPNEVYGEILPCKLVKFGTGKTVRVCDNDEIPHFVARNNNSGGLVVGDSSFMWRGAYLKDIDGSYITEDIVDVDFEATKLDIRTRYDALLIDNPNNENLDDYLDWLTQYEGATRYVTVRKINPNYDPILDYEPRINRPNEYTLCEWSGIAPVIVENSVSEGDYLVSNADGFGKTSNTVTRVKVLEVSDFSSMSSDYEISSRYTPYVTSYKYAICAVGGGF
jgi:hypothetical protein